MANESNYDEVNDDNIDPPTPRLKDGNVIIKLSPLPEHHLLIHESLLKRSQFFDATISGRFTNSAQETVVAGGDEADKKITILTYSLILLREGVYDTWQLEYIAEPSPILPTPKRGDEKYPSGDTPSDFHGQHFHGQHFHVTGYSNCLRDHKAIPKDSDDIPCRMWNEIARRYSVQDHKTLFAFLYGFSTEFSQASVQEAVLYLASVTANAQLYGILEPVASRISEAMMNLPGFWKDFADNAAFYVGLGYKLHCQEVYCDAFRHFIGANLDSDELLSRLPVLEDKADMAAFFFLQKRLCVTNLERKLEDGLRRLSLPQFPKKNRAGKILKWIPTTFFRNYLKKTGYAERQYGVNILRDRNEYLAQSIYSQWLTNRLNGLNHWDYKIKNMIKPLTLHQICDLICIHAANKDISIFNPTPKPTDEINTELLRILEVAASDIKYTLNEHTNINEIPCPIYDDYPKDSFWEYSKVMPARHDEGPKYFTHVYLEFKDIPWLAKEKGAEWMAEESWEPWDQDEYHEPASLEWMNAVGMQVSDNSELHRLDSLKEVPRRAGLSKQDD